VGRTSLDSVLATRPRSVQPGRVPAGRPRATIAIYVPERGATTENALSSENPNPLCRSVRGRQSPCGCECDWSGTQASCPIRTRVVPRCRPLPERETKFQRTEWSRHAERRMGAGSCMDVRGRPSALSAPRALLRPKREITRLSTVLARPPRDAEIAWSCLGVPPWGVVSAFSGPPRPLLRVEARFSHRGSVNHAASRARRFHAPVRMDADELVWSSPSGAAFVEHARQLAGGCLPPTQRQTRYSRAVDD
jgi:hypothetical protein